MHVHVRALVSLILFLHIRIVLLLTHSVGIDGAFSWLFVELLPIKYVVIFVAHPIE